MTTYEIMKKGLTQIYTKRMVLDDVITTVPLLNINIEAENKEEDYEDNIEEDNKDDNNNIDVEDDSDNDDAPSEQQPEVDTLQVASLSKEDIIRKKRRRRKRIT